MKPFFQKLESLPSQSVIFFDEEKPHFTVPWHFHPEIEILFVVKSSGTSYVGDGIRRFTHGEISMIGENVPHWWKSDKKYFESNARDGMKALIIQFNRDIFNTNFINLPEMVAIKDLLQKSQRGIQFTGKSRKLFGEQIAKIFQLSGISRITELILLLEMMANTKEFKYHASLGYSKSINTFDFYRFNKIHEHIILNLTKQIKLEEVAGIANICPTAFCRYFKKHTGKTFSSFLNEIRVGHACRLMLTENITISGASQESGFNNLSHFNDQFKRVMKITPSAYLSAYKNEGREMENDHAPLLEQKVEWDDPSFCHEQANVF
ncbi:MAG TPA: AraC family transcriptional regulator [Prolixibacteraceae bacterium]|nr:AraC family transcriptional regulator [Prolixibacteraceae bacterium]